MVKCGMYGREIEKEVRDSGVKCRVCEAPHVRVVSTFSVTSVGSICREVRVEMVAVDVITKPAPSALLVTDSDKATKIPLAVGEDFLISLMGRYALLEKVNLKTGDIIYSDSIALLLPNSTTIEHNLQVVERQRVKGGNIAFTLLYTKDTEAEGSRYLYARRFVINPTDLSLVTYGSEVQLANNVLHRSPWCEWAPLTIAPHQHLISHWRYSNVLHVDLNEMKVYKSPDYTPVGTYGCCPMGILRDRTSNYNALFLGRHYWIAGSYSYLNLINPRDWTLIVANNAYDSGCGAFLQRTLYRDNTGKVRMLVYGASGGYPYTTYASKWNAFYVNNDNVAQEFVVTAGASYGTFAAGCRYPHVLGVRADGRLQLLVYGKAWGGVDSIGVSCLDVNNTLGTPANLVQATVPYSTAEFSAQIQGWVNALLLESDWNYYVWAGVSTQAGAPNNVVFRVRDVPDLPDPDPYGYILVPRTGLIPTVLTLTVTPL